MANNRNVTLAAAVLVLAACSSNSPTEPGLPRSEVTGTYTLTTLSFDPDGSLPSYQIASRLSSNPPTLILTNLGVAQVSYLDPVTNVLSTANGTYTTTATQVRINFNSGQPYDGLLLMQRMNFDYTSPGVLSFAGTATPGVSRAALQALVPELANEQLLDPTPGTLEVVFTRQ